MRDRRLRGAGFLLGPSRSTAIQQNVAGQQLPHTHLTVMTNISTYRSPRAFAGLVVALLVLSACASAGSGEAEDLSTYDKIVQDQLN
jgi:hypothetical protein